MKKLKQHFKVMFWDFDGVIMNSNEIRDLGFKKVLSDFPDEQVDLLMNFHKRNGGLSRYVKFRFFFEDVQGREISQEEVSEWAQKFSEIMLELLVDSELLIDETVNFIKEHYNEKKMHIVSGSDQNELRYLCKKLNIDRYFNSIHGSPTPKIKLVKDLIIENSYDKGECVLIGDSVNDLEAAKENGIMFYGYNNKDLINKSDNYINKF